MTWVKLDADFPAHPKVVDLSDDAFRAFIGGLCYCNQYLTDGRITPGAIKRIASRKVSAELVAAGLWEQNGNGVMVHDYLEYQFSRSTVEANREAKAQAGRKGGLSSSQAKAQAKREQT